MGFFRRIDRRRFVLVTMLCGVAVAAWIRMGPIPAGLLDDRASASTLIVDRSGVPLYEALSADGTRATRLTAGTLPPFVVAATLAAEDRRFFSHPGVDPVAVMRAVKVNLAEGRVVEGGSTISQQVAKLLLNRRAPGRRRGLLAKLDEAALALRIEHWLTKQDVLALYLNLASYGNQIVGIERASRAYFGIAASQLTPAQAALLAGLPQRPAGFNPYKNPRATSARQHAVLRRMEAAGALPADQARLARDERLAFVRTTAPFHAPHFVEMVLAAAGDSRPARIETTLDSALQADVTGIVHGHRALLETHGAANVAVVVLANATGEWLAWEGSGDYFDTRRGGAINGPVVPRQPGSALKPFTYALAFEQGFSPATVLADVPSHFPTADPGVTYSPRNYDGRYRGPMLARRALAGSENVPAVALASELGVPSLQRFLARAGLTTFDKNAAHYGLGITLGNAEVRLDELVAAYSAFARGGTWLTPTSLLRTTRERQSRPFVSTRTAFWITDILSDPEARAYAFGRGGHLEFPFPVAVKTGTSQAYHDNWTIGYSRDVTVGVWVGNFNRTPLRNSSGVTGAAPIFHAVMLAATRRIHGPLPAVGDGSIVTPPWNVRETEICALSGSAANRWCPTRQREWIAIDAHLPLCNWHHMTDEGLLVVWPPQYREWARLRSPHSTRASARQADTVLTMPLRIANPPAGATYLIDPTLRREFQTLSLRVVTSSDDPIEWLVDGHVIGSAAPRTSLDWPLSPGQHRITARTARGDVDAATIVVR